MTPYDELMRDATGDETHYTVEVDLSGVTLKTGEPLDIYLRQADLPVPVLRKITKVRVIGSAQIAVQRVQFTHKELDGTAYAYGESPLGDGRVLLVATHQRPGEAKVSVRFDQKTK